MSATPPFEVGEIVYRIEDRPTLAARVLQIIYAPDPLGADFQVLIQYVEGNQGWWPSTYLRKPTEEEQQQLLTLEWQTQEQEPEEPHPPAEDS